MSQKDIFFAPFGGSEAKIVKNQWVFAPPIKKMLKTNWFLTIFKGSTPRTTGRAEPLEGVGGG